MSLKQQFRFWFNFSPSERNGILFLFVLLLLFIGTKYYLKYQTEQQKAQPVDFSQFENDIDTFLTQNTIKPKRIKTTNDSDSVDFEDTRHQYSKRKYDKKYRSKKSLQKTPFKEIIELNVADTAMLKSIYGIGEKLSVRIVKYRKKLGGFYSVEQLKEVYGLRTENFKKIKPQLHCDSTLVQKININTVSFKTLLHHPYLNYKQVKAIFRYKDKHQKINNIDVLRSLLGKDYEKISHYLTCQ
jgi:competence ComEA-like helix-hairpin-helix protein